MICLIGPFPPPLHGMSAVNKTVHSLLTKANLKVRIIDLSTGSLDRSYLVRIRKLWRVLSGMASLLLIALKRTKARVYISLSGGSGQLFELPLIALCRLLGWPIVLHHHSFAYVNKSYWPSRLLFGAAGRGARHIALCSEMAHKLQQLYPVVMNIDILSNAAFIDAGTSTERFSRASGDFTIGFLGNIAREKGIYTFIESIKLISERGAKVKGVIAGPFQDAQTEQAVSAELRRVTNIEHVGRKYGADKDQFLNDLDALLFPTEYVNEAEPLTILEAMSKGVPILAISRGCIKEVIPDIPAPAFSSKDDFVSNIAGVIEKLSTDDDYYRLCRQASLTQFLLIKTCADGQLSELCNHLAGESS